MSGTARRAKELAEHFVKKGHNVKIITSYPRKFRSIPGERFKKKELISGVKVYRVINLFEVKKNPILRMISYFFFVVNSFYLGIKLGKQSNIIVSIAPLSSGIIGALIQIITKKHHHFDIPDILPDLGIAAGMIKNKKLIYLLRKLEKWVYKHSKSISTCTQGQRKNISSKGVNSNKLYWIPDWIDNKFFKENLSKYQNEVIKFFSSKNKHMITFVGNIGALQNPKTFIQVMNLLDKNSPNEFVFNFVGDGIMLGEMKELAERNKLDNIQFIGRVKREYIPAIMKLSDVLITNYVSHEHLDLYIPGKLFEYAISAQPIVVGAKGDSRDFINKYNLGIPVNPSNPEAFKNAILKIIDGSFKFNPKTEQFENDFSINNVTSRYDKIFNKYIKC